jgi:hypothetical protein
VTKIARIAVAAALVLAAGTASAAQAKGPPSSGGYSRYGAAGCGLGSLLFGDQPGLVQVLAATTNGTFGNQTFGITTGTLNCGEPAVGRGGAALFIEGNREALAKDVSRGQGETITTLSHLAGCKDPAAVGAALKAQHGAVFGAPAEQVTEKVLSTLKSDASLSCTELG